MCGCAQESCALRHTRYPIHWIAWALALNCAAFSVSSESGLFSASVGRVRLFQATMELMSDADLLECAVSELAILDRARASR
jgi:hypothetical protein